jgi:hypothetical protein
MHGDLEDLDLDQHPNYVPRDASRGFANEADATLALELDSGDTAAQATQLVFSDRGTPIWRISKGTTDTLSIVGAQSGASILIFDKNAPTSAFVLDSAGNIGLGTASPAVKLHVLGSARVEGPELRVDSNANNDTTVTIDSGQTIPQDSHLVFADQGTDVWQVNKDAANDLNIRRISDPTPHFVFRSGNLTDLSTQFTKSALDPMDMHAHAARHWVGGSDPLGGAAQTVGNDRGNSSFTGLISSWVTYHTTTLDFTGRSGPSAVLVWGQGRYLSSGDSTGTFEQRLVFDGVQQGLAAGNTANQSGEEMSAGILVWMELPAAVNLIELQAREMNRSVDFRQGTINWLDLGETISMVDL